MLPIGAVLASQTAIMPTLRAHGRLTPLPVHGPGHPVSRLDRPLTPAVALAQHNVLGQTGIRSQHVGNLVLLGQYSAKGASLGFVAAAVWLAYDPRRALLAPAIQQRAAWQAHTLNWAIAAYQANSEPPLNAPRLDLVG